MKNANNCPTSRPGVVLLVVLAMLTLFAVVAIAFVSMSESTAVSFTVNKAAQTQSRPEPDLLFTYAMSQLIFENDNPNSSLWTHGLVRNMYGSGNIPFAGLGRVRSLTDPELEPVDLWPTVTTDYLHTKGRAAVRGTLAGRTVFNEATYGNLASTYTYPDANHAFLAATSADGVVYRRSFVRSPEGVTDPYTSDPSLFGRWWTDSDPFMVRIVPIDGAGAPGLVQQAIATGAGSPQWQELVRELLRRRAMVMRPRPSLQDSMLISLGTTRAAFETNLIATANGMGLSLAGVYHTNFPIPDDLGGDVKNLPNWYRTRVSPNGAAPVFASNDSIWIDLDFPVQTDPATGRRYKPVFAFHIEDLDGKVNLNFHGNTVLGAGFAPLHASNQGWGPWEINPNRVLYPSFAATASTPEITRMYGNTQVGGGGVVPVFEKGRFGADGQVGTATSAPLLNSVPHFYGQVNYNARDVANAPNSGVDAVLPSGTNLLPSFPPSYLNGYPPELLRHPLLHQSPLGAGDDRFFSAANMEALLRHGDKGSYGVASDLRRLLPLSFREPYANQGSRMARLQVTTTSYDVTRPSLQPYLNNLSPGGAETLNGYPLAAWTTTGNSRAVALQAPGANLGNLPAGVSGGEFLLNSPLFRAVNSPTINSPSATVPHPNLNLNGVLGKVNLNRYLRPYPHLGSFNLNAPAIDGAANNYVAGTVPPPNPGTYAPITAAEALPPQPNPPVLPEDLIAGGIPVARFDRHPAYLAVAAAAERDRQMLAMEIFRRLVALTGVQVPPIPAGGAADPGFRAALRPLRSLAQLAANIVDYIDEDEINTPFCFYTLLDALGGPIDPLNPPTAGAVAAYNLFEVVNPTETDPERRIRQYWVYGTEMPRLVLTEVLGEYRPTAPGSTMPVKLWAELASTLPAAFPANNPNPTDLRAEPLYVPALSSDPNSDYAPYQFVVAETQIADPNEGPLLATPNDNFNTTGVWHAQPAPTRARTVKADFQPALGYAPQGNTPAPPAALLNPARVPPGRVVIVGPPNASDPAEPPDERRSIQANGNGSNGHAGETTGRVPDNTFFLRTNNLAYSVTYNGPNDWQFSGQMVNDWDPNQGVTVLLRRLANPYLPPQTDPGLPGYNPYLTIDYMSHVPLYNAATGGTYKSVGKFQPMAAHRTQQYLQQPNPDNVATVQTVHTLGSLNNPDAPFQPPAAFDWLAHLDRRLTSIAELLQVSGYKPHELTQKFMMDVQLVNPVTADPAAKQIVQVQVADAGHPMPAIRAGMTLRVGGNDPTSNPEYIYVYDARPNATNPNQLDIQAIFLQDHNPGVRISVPHSHRAPWLDDSRRLLRLWEFLDATNVFQSRVAITAAITPLPIASLPATDTHFQVALQGSYGVNGNDLLHFEPAVGNYVELLDTTTGIYWTGIITTTYSNELFNVVVPGGPATFNAGSMVLGYSHIGRPPAKVNINAVRSVEVFRALCDAQGGNSFNPPIATLPAVVAAGQNTVSLTLPIADPTQPTIPYGFFNGVPWTITVPHTYTPTVVGPPLLAGTALEFRHPVNGPETVYVTNIAVGGPVIPPAGPGLPPTRVFNITFNPPLQSSLLAAHQQAYPAGSVVTVDNVTMFFNHLVLTRDGNFIPGLGNYAGRPFQGYSRGAVAPGTQPQYPLGSGIVDSLFRPEPVVSAAAPAPQPGRTLLELPAAHPAKGHEIMAKIAGNVTSRSNVFAVWCTTGFFEVDANGNLQQEIGRQNGRHVRHRFFAIVDRSQIDPWVQQQGPNYNVLTGFGGVANTTANFLLGNSAIDPRKPRVMVDATATVVGGPDAQGRHVIQLQTGTNLGIFAGQSLQVNGSNQWVTIHAVLPGPQYLVGFNGAVPGGPFRLSSILPAPIIHASVVE